MKTALFAILVLIGQFGFSQLVESSATIINDWTPTQSNYKSTACGPDEVQYTIAKANGLQVLDINNATSALGTCQYFDAPQALTIDAVTFFAYKANASGGLVQHLEVELFLAGADSMPTGAALTSVTVPVDTTFNGGLLSALEKVANFSIPITVTQPYCVVISNNSSNSVNLVSNDYTTAPTPDGAYEWLSSINIAGTWIRSYGINVGGPLFNADWLFYPSVSYTLTASATQDQTCLSAGGTMNYTNTSSPILQNRMYNQAAYVGAPQLSYTWDFGDGSPTENTVSPSHTFPAGVFTVTLTDTIFGWTTNCAHDTSMSTAANIVADYSFVTTNLTSNFTDLTVNDDVTGSWLWDFGDGNTSTQQNPTHIYAAPGTYTVCLTSTNSCISDSVCQSVTVCSPPTPSYTFNANSLTVDFTDGSTVSGGTSWLWDLGDGNTSTQQNPSHTYSAAGTYTVCLTVTDGCATDSVCQTVTVVNCPTPTSYYTFTANSLNVDFMDGSTVTGSASWLWDFGDGNTSTQQNPSHTYAADGGYTVCLTVSDACGTDSVCQTVIVANCPTPVAAYTYNTNSLNVDFTDTSTYTVTAITSWLWDFGDGNTSTQQNPSHTYSAAGTYTVCLTMSDACGVDSVCQTVTVTNCPTPTPSYSFTATSLTVDFTDASTVTGTASWLWDFGDGNTSAVQNPSHTYGADGIYTVCLTVTDDCATDSVCQSVDVSMVGVLELSADDFKIYPNPGNSIINLELGGHSEAVSTVSILDVQGRQLQTLNGDRIREKMVLDMTNYSTGVYLLSIKTNSDQVLVRKVFIK